jgi:hypothetical protein
MQRMDSDSSCCHSPCCSYSVDSCSVPFLELNEHVPFLWFKGPWCSVRWLLSLKSSVLAFSSSCFILFLCRTDDLKQFGQPVFNITAIAVFMMIGALEVFRSSTASSAVYLWHLMAYEGRPLGVRRPYGRIRSFLITQVSD